jgi:hypothetical protein
MAGPQGGTVGDPGAPTTYVRDVDSGPPGRHCRRPESTPLPMSETWIVGPLGGTARDPGSPTTYVGDVDGGPPGRR